MEYKVYIAESFYFEDLENYETCLIRDYGLDPEKYINNILFQIENLSTFPMRRGLGDNPHSPVRCINVSKHSTMQVYYTVDNQNYTVVAIALYSSAAPSSDYIIRRVNQRIIGIENGTEEVYSLNSLGS
jgi:hypothetical protein